jgi:hypothetical protein
MQGTNSNDAKSDRMEDDSSDMCVDSENQLGSFSEGAAATEDAPVQDQNLKYVQQWILVYALPFFYGAITRLPFLYFVIHMRITFDLDWLSIWYFYWSGWKPCRFTLKQQRQNTLHRGDDSGGIQRDLGLHADLHEECL